MMRQIILTTENKEEMAKKNINDSDIDMTMNEIASDIEEDNIKGNEVAEGEWTKEKWIKNKR